jgi:hypothetical protein
VLSVCLLCIGADCADHRQVQTGRLTAFPRRSPVARDHVSLETKFNDIISINGESLMTLFTNLLVFVMFLALIGLGLLSGNEKIMQGAIPTTFTSFLILIFSFIEPELRKNKKYEPIEAMLGCGAIFLVLSCAVYTFWLYALGGLN